MATQVIGAGRRSRVFAALVASALALVVFVLVAQATSIWSTQSGPQAGPAPVQVSFSAKELRDLSKGTELPNGCQIKYGC